MKGELDTYAQTTLQFVEETQRAATVEEVSALVIQHYKNIGYDYVTIWSLPAPGQPPEQGVMLNTRPTAYIERYVEEDQIKLDPAITELRNSLRPYSWSDIKQRRALSKKEVSIIDEAQEFGINDGVIVPIVTVEGSLSVVSPCGGNPDLSQRARSAVEIIGIVGHQALKRVLWSNSANDPKRPHLTRRECEILQWLAHGKSDDEIGDILHISQSTVTAHYENAKRKLGATKRASAVVEALRWRYIHL